MEYTKREQILDALAAMAAARPGMDFENYGDLAAYRKDAREIVKDLHDARAMLAAIRWRTSITEADVRAAFDNNAGRTTLEERADGSLAIRYCAGQCYWMEYRAGVCRILSRVLWSYFRANMPAPFTPPLCSGDWYAWPDKRGGKIPISAGDYLRRTAKRELGGPLARRWFN